MRFDTRLLRRLFGKLVHDILPAALASLLGGFLVAHFHLNRVSGPVTVPVAQASPEMMQLLRDEHGLIVSYVKARVANEKIANERIANERKFAASAGERRLHAAVEMQPAPAVPRPTTIVALGPARPAPLRAKASVVGTSVAAGPSLPPLAIAPAPQGDGLPPVPVARNDDSLLAKTIGKTIGVVGHVVGVTQRAVSAVGGIPSWLGSIGDRIGDDPNPRPPARLMSEL